MAVTSYVVYAACGAYGGRALLRAVGRGECFEAFVEERCLVPIKASARYRRKFGWGGWGGDRGLRFRMGRSVMREISVCPAAYRMQPDAHVDEDQTISIHVLMKKTTVWNPQSIRVLPNV